MISKRLVVFLPNPNYEGSRPQPFDAIAVKMKTEPADAIDQVLQGTLDAAMLAGDNPVSGPGSSVAEEWGPASANAKNGDQRWFGAPRLGVDFIALNTTRPAFGDPDVRRAVALAIDRYALSRIWVNAPTSGLLVPSVPGSAGIDASVPDPDVEQALALMGGRELDVTMQGFPEVWGCGPCREFEVAVTGQLKAIGITVTVRHPDEEHIGDAFERDSEVDLLLWDTGTDVPDPVAFLGALRDIPWVGDANLQELDRLVDLEGQARIDGAGTLANRIVDLDTLVIPIAYPVFPFFISERIGCGFIQPAIGAVDLLSLCVDEDVTSSPSASALP
jgi:ABC-type transport system substrate-binding protein